MQPLVFRSRGLLGREVTLDIAGIRRGKTVVLWDDLDLYRYEWLDWSRPGDLVAVGRAGNWIRLAPFAERWPEVSERFLGEAHVRLRDAYVHPFAFTDDALTCAGRSLALGAVEHVEIAAIGRDVIVIVHERNAGEWVQCDVAQIACFWRWIEMLVEREVTIRSVLDFYLPPALAHIQAAVARDERVPKARLV